MESEKDIQFTKELVCELCRQFFQAGWVTGTGGSISIRLGNLIFMTPSGVQKERIKPDEIFIVDKDCTILSCPQVKPGFNPKLSDCAPLFLHAYNQRDAGAVLHSHSICCNLVTSLFEGCSEFKISHQEMIKGIKGYGYFDELVIPIIENTAWEHELADSLGDAIRKYPKSCAVLVRRHGMYVWGDNWEQAKRHGECLHYLFDLAINMKKFGMDFNSPPLPIQSIAQYPTLLYKRNLSEVVEPTDNGQQSKKLWTLSPYKHVLFDIEGTISSISFVKDVLFPYSRANAGAFLQANVHNMEVIHVVEELSKFILNQPTSSDYDVGTLKALALCTKRELSSNEIDVLVKYIDQYILEDRKVTPLKELQSMIWKGGYESGVLNAPLYKDFVPFMEKLVGLKMKASIYSSGSRKAQQLFLQYSTQGDVRYLCSSYFDTKVGQKNVDSTYVDILLTLGYSGENASQVLFFTDVLAEAEAAQQAGMQAVIVKREGNPPILSDHSFLTIESFDEMKN